MMKPKIPLQAWAAARYDPPPSPYILRQWRESGEIYPPPERVGRDYMVSPDARRLTGLEPAGGGLVAQLRAA